MELGCGDRKAQRGASEKWVVATVTTGLLALVSRSDRCSDSVDEACATERLDQKRGGPSCLASFANSRFIIRGDDNRRNCDTSAHQMVLQVESCEIRHVQIDHEALWQTVSERRQEVPRRAIGLYVK